MFRALIFGSIGTLTETSEWQREAFNAAFREHGLDWVWSPTEYRAMISGDRIAVGGSNRIAGYAWSQGVSMEPEQARAVHATKTRLFERRMSDERLPLNPGVFHLLAEAQARGIRTVFASTTARASIDGMLRASVPSLAGRFDLVMSGDDVERSKPDPEIYLAVLERLQIDASAALAIEDSAPSLAAARAAGIVTYAVPGLLWRGTPFEGAAGIFESLNGVSLDTLAMPLGG